MTPRRRLPVAPPPVTHLVPTEGKRLDCAHAMACLSGHIAAHTHRDTPASCPPGCRWHEAPPSSVEEYVYRGGAGALAQIETGGRRGYHDSGDGRRLGQPPQPGRKAVRGARRRA